MKVAIVHDWLVTYAGAEKVLEQILNLYPNADIYTVVDFLPDNKRDFLKNKTTQTTFIQKIPLSERFYRHLLPLMPLAIEQFDLSQYDLIISSSYAVAKGIITGPHQLHISYVHSPIRYAWDLQHQYLKESKLQTGIRGMAAKYMLHKMRLWDYRTSSGVDYFIANSEFIAKRIWKVYRRESTVIYPPVDVHNFKYCDKKSDYYITLSRMVPYKKIDLIVEAFSEMPDKRLIVIGSGPDYKKIKAKATSNVEILGFQPQEVVVDLLSKARAFIFAAEEDFGISVVEAQASGTPVIAYGRGGALETVNDSKHTNQTGLFFYEQSVTAIRGAVDEFEKQEGLIRSIDCLKNASKFSTSTFLNKLENYINQTYEFSKQNTLSTRKETYEREYVF